MCLIRDCELSSASLCFLFSVFTGESALCSYWSASSNMWWNLSYSAREDKKFRHTRLSVGTSFVVHYDSLHEIKPSAIARNAHFPSWRRPTDILQSELDRTEKTTLKSTHFFDWQAWSQLLLTTSNTSAPTIYFALVDKRARNGRFEVRKTPS